VIDRVNAIALEYRLPLGRGRQVLERRIAPARSIGVHLPADVPSRPAGRAPELRGHELFTEPGEVRAIR
jgi:hypothetical protein